MLGGGKSIFPYDTEARVFELVSTTTASTGVQVCNYAAGPLTRSRASPIIFG